MYNQENGVNEFAAICNVTFQGMEMAGSFTKETAKAFLKLAKFLMTVKTWAKNKVKDHEYQRAGKKKQKVMKDKFQGEVLYGKIESVKSIAEKQSSSIRVLSEDQRERLPDKKWVISNLKKLAKAHGLEYCVLPNKKSNDSFIQYPKQQEAVYQEIIAELQEQMKKECEKLFIVFDKENEQKCEQAVIACKEAIAAKKEEIKRTKEDLQSYRKVNDKVGEEKYGEKLIVLKAELEDLKEKKIELTEKWNEARKQNGKDLIEQLPEETKEAVQGQIIQQVTGAQYLEQSGLLSTSDEEFDAIMKDTFPLEYAEIEKSIQQKAEEIKEGQRTDPAKQEQKKEFVRQVNQETRKEEKKKGTIVDIEIPAAAYVKTGENEISFPHPDYPEFMITVPANGICGTVDSSNVKRENGKLEGYLTCSVYKDAEISIRVPVLNAISGKPQMDSEGAMQFVTNRMTYEEFNKHVKDVGATAAAAMWKKQRELQKTARVTQMPEMLQKGKVNVKK